MKKLSIMLLLILLITACSSQDKQGFMLHFSVIGDVETTQQIASMDGFSTVKTEHNGKRVDTLCLADVIAQAKPRSDSFDIILKGDDGLSSRIDGSTAKDCYIAFSNEYAWECINPKHPISSQIKRLSEIIIVTKEDAITNDLGKIGLVDLNNNKYVTPGQLLAGSFMYMNQQEGRSEKNGNYVTVYTPHKQIPISELITEHDNLYIAGYKGAIAYDRGSGSFELCENSVNYVYEDGKNVIENISGIMSNPPLISVMDVYKDSLYMLEKNEKVLVILLDGFGYKMYKNAEATGSIPYLSSCDLQRAVTIFPSISNVSLASMLSGKPPIENGIVAKKDKELIGDDLFKTASEAGNVCMYIEGNLKLINTSLEPSLNADSNSNGTDDEVYENALKAISQDPKLLFVHFHGIDDVAHKNGPYSEQTIQKMRELDAMSAKLAAIWNGKIIILADHGQHNSGEVGTHGVFCEEDMLVPYGIIGGQK